MSFDFQNPYASTRLPLFARNVVSNSHPLAAQAGLRMMLKGGNAVDAAIAAAAAITLTDTQPATTWNMLQPSEYGFYSNVNPQVDHPRWSQATERRIGEDGVFQRKRPTLMFNGYEAQVGQLYAGMDLRKFY